MSSEGVVPDLGCAILSIRYDFEKHTGHVYVPANNCVDMKSTIEFFTMLCPHVIHIITWCDNNLDTQYVIHKGEWIAI
jgi:hypothetical protein